MTAYGTIERAVTAMRDGASDYLVKPFEAEELIAASSASSARRRRRLATRRWPPTHAAARRWSWRARAAQTTSPCC